MYDELGFVRRIETTTNDVTFFKHHRKVEHRDGTWERKVAPVMRSIYSLPDVRELMGQANRRYLEKISRPVRPAGTSFRPWAGTKQRPQRNSAD